MSGHKRATISIGQADRLRMQEFQTRLQQVESDFQHIQGKIQHIQQENLRQSLDELIARSEHYTQSMGSLDERLRQIETSTSQAIVDQTAAMASNIEAIGTGIWDETSHLLLQQSQVIQNVLDESLQAQQFEFAQIRKHLSRIRSNEAHKQRIAIQAYENARSILSSLQTTYDLDQSLPGLVGQISIQLNQAAENIDNGFFEAGLMASQQVYQRISAARLELENLVLQKNLAYSMTLAKANELLEKTVYFKTVHAVDLDGNDLDEIIDVDYWSLGAWREIHKDCRRIITQLSRRNDQLDLGDLAEIQQRCEIQDARLPEIIGQARMNVLASQIRFNLAECLVQALQEQGFALQESCYAGGDQRQSYQTALCNLEGSEVFVQINPQTENPLLHTIDLISKDPEVRSEHELRQRAKSLQSTLKAYGLNVSQFQQQEPALQSESAGIIPIASQDHLPQQLAHR